MKKKDHTYLVCYDISAPKRWRRIYKLMKGFGDWLQLSIFQCRLNREKMLRMMDGLSDLMDKTEDHVMIIDLGPSESVDLRIQSLGRTFEPIEKKPVIV